jgi:membrane-bound metal-dependent hydrolase YbcI (DUF457 family)
MALPIAHGLIGASVVIALWQNDRSEYIWKPIILGTLVAILPDLDFILTWFLHLSSDWHRSFSHSIVFAYLVGWGASRLLGRRDLRSVLIIGTAGATHGILDALTSTREGAELLWPFFSERFAFEIFEYPNVLDVRFSFQDDLLLISGLLRMIEFCFGEALIFAPVLLLSILYRRVFVRSTV